MYYILLCTVIVAKIKCLSIHRSVFPTGERNHKCPVCERSYRDPYTMQRHHQTVHLGQYRYSCPKCYRKFDKISRLNSHTCNQPARKQSKVEGASSPEVDGKPVSAGSMSSPGHVVVVVVNVVYFQRQHQTK